MVVGVDVQVEQRRAARGGERVEHLRVAPSDTFGTHSSTTCRVRPCARADGSPVECRAPCGIGLALPQYDYSVAGESPLRWDTVVELRARAADAAGFDSLWLSDHLFLDVAKYGGPPEPRRRVRPARRRSPRSPAR